jgi:hypothetical protein
VSGLAPRALRNCAPSASWGASVRPLNFTVRGARVSDYFTAISTSSLPLRWEAVAAIGVLLFLVGYALNREAWRMFRARPHVGRDEAYDSIKRWGWVLPLRQFVYAAAIFLVGLYAGGPLFTLLAGGVVVALFYTAARQARYILQYRSLEHSGAVLKATSESYATRLRQAAQSHFQAALFFMSLGLVVGHLALFGGGLILGVVAIEYRRRMRRAEAHL